ncbi:MAG TPA: bifunctional phosphoribosyl-AMP cyclohydrolase/phosphoribosyl-ATP diphosphatase HisIE [Pyrinomonadaceae bacterium]|nr:bifunctional phosphoribosyl-AMP cyclohydrolase/phosphoribosyl-ATP diphosphatase HisIE [Pyrinomonadaceae bacterium]
MNFRLAELKFDSNGLLPAIVQDAKTLAVLTVAYVNEESLRRTIDTGETWFWSRSRNELWHKGETSGHTQTVVDIKLDCDQDAIVILVDANGPACHTGAVSCFHNSLADAVATGPRVRTENFGNLLDQLYQLIVSRKQERPEGSYTTYLFDEGLDKILKKVGEESAETIVAAKNANKKLFVGEVSDLLYHLLVLLVEQGVELNDIRAELARRRVPKQ